jgi:GNAT superfamily N-acetyltransferase
MSGLDIAELTSPDDVDLVGAFVAVEQAVATDLDPDDPLPGRAELLAERFSTRGDEPRRVWVAAAHGTPMATAWLTRMVRPGAFQLAEVEVRVIPGHRSRGVGRELSALVLRAAVEAGATSVIAYPHDAAGVALCRRAGMTHRQDERLSRLLVADLDEDQQRDWRDGSAAEAAGYALHRFTGTCPDELLAPLVQARTGMDDAPLDDVEYERAAVTAETVRDQERVDREGGFEVFISLVTGPEGDGAGVSVLLVHSERPAVGHQGDTAVVPAHRGRGLGRWLKASNLEAVRHAHPELASVYTYNAATNRWMLDINVAMGFRPYRTYAAHQADTTDLALEGFAAAG